MILTSLRFAWSMAFSTPTAMSSSAAQTASMCLKRVRVILHHLERVVAIPVRVFRVENLDVQIAFNAR